MLSMCAASIGVVLFVLLILGVGLAYDAHRSAEGYSGRVK